MPIIVATVLAMMVLAMVDLPSTPGAIDLLVLSPHLDDAALSLGAHLYTLARRGVRVSVLTLATADPADGLSPLAEDLHRRWGLGADAMAVRRGEDLEACRVLGVEATVERVDQNEAGDIVAICSRERERQPIALVDLPMPHPLPKGAEWIAAYRRWVRHMYRGEGD